MQRKKPTSTYLVIIGTLDTQSQIALRATAPIHQAAVQIAQVGPYQTKAAFVMATTMHFHQSGSRRLEDWLDNAWEYYYQITHSDNMEPAFIYKIRDNHQHNHHCYCFNDPHITINGRLYDPGLHNWAVNAVWALANIHKNRSFLLLSELKDEFMLREDNINECSALTKELAVVVKAGYRPDPSSRHELKLIPPSNEHSHRGANLANLQPNDAEAIVTYKNLQLHQQTLFRYQVRSADELIAAIESTNGCLAEQKKLICKHSFLIDDPEKLFRFLSTANHITDTGLHNIAISYFKPYKHNYTFKRLLSFMQIANDAGIEGRLKIVLKCRSLLKDGYNIAAILPQLKTCDRLNCALRLINNITDEKQLEAVASALLNSEREALQSRYAAKSRQPGIQRY